MSKKRKSNFRNQTVNDAKRQKKKSYGYLNLPKNVKILNIKEKTREILLDFIPYIVTDSRHPDRDIDEDRAVVDALWYKRPFKVHRNIGVDNDTFVCLTSFNKKCPICEWVADQRRKGVDWDELKDVAAKDRNLYAVVPIDSDNHEEIVHVWDMSWHLFQNELNDQLEEDPNNGEFPELEEGLTLKVKFRWKKFGKNLFPETRDIEFKDRGRQYTEDILNDVPNLDEMLSVLSYKELEAKFLELENEEADEDDKVENIKDEKPKKPTFHRISKTTETEPKDKHEREEDKSEKENKKQSSKNECPKGYKYGIDFDRYNECADCDEWDGCMEEQEKQE